MELKDFDITQINKDTKVVVFRFDFNNLYQDNHDYIMQHLKSIADSLKGVGVTAIFTDTDINIEPLTDELLNVGNLKHFNQ